MKLPPLPIDDALPRLREVLAAGPFAVLVAPPGAGKTTRVPLALLEAAWRGDGRIVMLEPRRLAARAAARRMAQSLGEAVGETVGYRVRLDAKVSARTRIEVVTEGVFTRMLLDDPELAGVAAVIFDEFHERSLDADLGLALALDAAALREDLRILVMSATLDGARVSALMDAAPVVESLGRAFPVETLYRDRDPALRLEEQVAAVTLAALREQPGSALVFRPGQAEIARTAERLAGRVAADVEVTPLYGQLSPEEQDRAVMPAPAGWRKVVLATSIAETSLTIEGVRIVVDSGFRRAPAYEPAIGLTVLETRRISRAAAEQRRGRAGRVEPGVCYRLWGEGQNAAMAAFDPPEMLEADLSGLALDLAGWGVSDPGQLRFLDPPPKPAWTEAVALLGELEAIDAQGRITVEGKALARLPLHPRLAHMVHRAAEEDDALTAAEIAVLLGERGLGGDEIDIGGRLERFRRERGKRAEEARGLARRWAGMVGNTGTGGEVGRHLARAYPDRVAQRAGGRGRFRLANGRQAAMEETEALAAAEYLVVTDVKGAAASGRIRAAARIDRETIEELFAGEIVEEVAMAFDRAARAVRARRVRRLGALRLDEAPVAVGDPEAAARALAEGIAELGIGLLPWSREQQALRQRATYLRGAIGAEWPDLSDAALAADVAWLVPVLVGKTALAEVTAEDLAAALEGLLPWA
ncbi:MAG: ATP-dependent helicase HrpB, partial [Devosia sp.]